MQAKMKLIFDVPVQFAENFTKKAKQLRIAKVELFRRMFTKFFEKEKGR
jgi:hypothetical protein